jgi:hypothetical protein
MKNILIFILFSISLTSCVQKKKSHSDKIKIDKNIEKEVKSKISKSTIIPSEDLKIYDNILIADFFENDSLTISTKGQNKKLVFMSAFYNQNDTLIIDGLFGVFAGFGFSLKIKDDKAVVYHLLESKDSPIYSRSKRDSLKFRIEVPCSNTSLTISKIPELKEGEIIYGVVEFVGSNYYQSESLDNNGEVKPRKKKRMNMKVYFKSIYLNI